MSLDNMNDSMRNLLKVLENLKPFEVKPVVIKLLYDAETCLVNGVTFEETDRPYVEITREQFDQGIQYKKLRVVNGKLEEVPRKKIKKLSLVQGNRWFTTKDNMLIIGNERGWDERGNN